MLTRAVSVVVPAHDEQELLPACLHALRQAAAQPGVPPVRVLVVADTCSDGSVDAARAGGAEVLRGGAAQRGRQPPGRPRPAARRQSHAAGRALARHDRRRQSRPARLVHRPADAARQGCRRRRRDRAGRRLVRARRRGRPPLRRPLRLGGGRAPARARGEPEPVRGGLPAVGGLPPLDLAEDHALVDALVGLGLRVARPTTSPVVTSARTDARCSGGFGDLLASLGAPAA